MADTPAIASLAHARERTIEALTGHFAADDLTMDELERRLELAYRATNIVELEALTADLKAAVSRGPVTAPEENVDRDYVRTFFGSVTRANGWIAPEHLDVRAVFGSATIDLTQAILPKAAVIDIRIKSAWSSVKIIIPPGMRIVNRMGMIMSSTDEEPDLAAIDKSVPVVRLSGWAFLAGVKIRVRRKEDPVPLVGGAADDAPEPSGSDG